MPIQMTEEIAISAIAMSSPVTNGLELTSLYEWFEKKNSLYEILKCNRAYLFDQTINGPDHGAIDIQIDINPLKHELKYAG